MRANLQTLTFALALALPTVVSAQVSNDMTCDEAMAYYSEHKMIETRDGDQTLPIDQGVPVAQREELTCGEGIDVEATFVQTSDNPQCAVAYHCAD